MKGGGRLDMKRSTVRKDLKCIKCGNVQQIHRRTGRNKPAGHKKGLHCIVCGKKTKHEELPEFWNGGSVNET